MSKRRKDEKHDSSSLSKVAKAGAAALSVGVGVAAFKHTKISKKLTSEYIPALSKTSKQISKDVRNLKATRSGFDRRIQATDLHDIYKNHLKDNRTFKGELQSLRNNPLKIDTSDKSRNLLGRVKNMSQAINNTSGQIAKKAYKDEQIAREIKNLAFKYKDKDVKHINDIGREAFASIEKKSYKIDDQYYFSDFLSEKFKKANFTKTEREDFLKYVYDAKERIEVNAQVHKNFSKAKESIDNIIKSSIVKDKARNNSIYSKIDDFIKNRFDMDIDSEYILHGSKAATWKDIKDFKKKNPKSFDDDLFKFKIKNNFSKGKNYQTLDLEQIMDDLEEELNTNLDDLIFDKNIRIKDGEIINNTQFNQMLDKQLDNFASSTLGRLFGVTDYVLTKEAPIISSMAALSTGKEAVYEIGNNSTILQKSKVAIANTSNNQAELFEFFLNANNELELNENALAKGHLRNNSHGKSARLAKEIVGSNKIVLEQNEGLLSKILDIKQDGSPTLNTRIKSIIGIKNNENWARNSLKRTKKLFTNDESMDKKVDELALSYLRKNNIDFNEDSLNDARLQIISNIIEDQNDLSSMLNDLTAYKQIDNQTIANLINSNLISNEESLNLLKVFNDNNYNNINDLIEAISHDNEGSMINFYNKDLEYIINNGFTDTDRINSLKNISQSSSTRIANLIGVESTNVLNTEDVLRREVVKEVLLREAGSYTSSNNNSFLLTEKGMSKLENLLNNSNLDNIQENNLRNLANWGILQSSLKLNSGIDEVYSIDRMIGPDGLLTKFDNLLSSNSQFKVRFSQTLDDLASRQSIFDSSVIGNINENYINEYNNYTFMENSSLKKALLGDITSINDFIKQSAKELIAGRNDLKNYTTLTQIPQFMVSRLMWGIGEVGLGFSSESTSSTLDLIKNIALKRVLPVMGALSLYDYLNYESENFTGVSITGAAANAVANLDLGARKLAYQIGIGQALDYVKESSVLGEYWTGSSDFQTEEERAEWYKNGYSAVRGGRFWGFGSTSEFRGGGIQYYQPNYLKRAHSNYNEVSIYGSAEEKFKHSWLPSLRHPLSPLRAALDPYWLEKKNMDDRPYPLTGKMFAEGTPWGAILNPTIGEILKPVRMLPEVRKRLGNDGRDIRTVVKNINDRIKAKRDENDDMIIVNGTDIRTAKYVPYANTDNQYMNISFNNGQAYAPGINYMDSIANLKSFDAPNGKIPVTKNVPVNVNTEIIDEMFSTSQDSKKFVNDIIGGVNNEIKKLSKRFGIGKGDISDNTAYGASNLPSRDNSTYVYTNLVNQRNQFNSEYYSSTDAKMVDKNLAKDYLRDGMYSMGELSGIYNFLKDFTFGNDGYSFRYENAGQMTSFSRHFWDAQVGGMGGELMEIARRFFPSEDKSRINYNPLRNSMPEWLPERFLTGDPYTALPKGEMRMPGRGYETLNELHPDMFGEYGAFDRMKILGDIAPTSEEYKIWRNIARNTVTDESLIKQMEEIEKRVKKTSSKHEFYDYRYVNNNVEQKKGVVKSWDGNIVTLASGEQLRLGGINLNETADLSEYLKTGQKIHYRVVKDSIKRLEDGIATNAVIYKNVNGSGVNINNELVKSGMASRDENDTTAIGYLANATSFQQTLGAIQEVIGHAQIPFLHNKYMKIETARESFRQEHVYGNTFPTWDHPIEGFVKPAFNQVFGQSFSRHLLAAGSSALYFNMKHITNNSTARIASGALMAGLNPAALLGMGVEFISNLGLKAIGNGSNLLNVERGAAIGSIVGSVGWGLANAENPFKAMASFAVAGEAASKYLNIENLAKRFGKNFDTGKGALIGASIGLAISALKNPSFSKDMFRKEWIPESTEKKYELDEYFDRLEYIKYKGLYNQAAARAFLFEGNINIKKIFKEIDKNKEKIAKLTRKAEKLSNKYSAGGYEYEQKMSEINQKITALENKPTVLKGGKYTKAAVSYKKAMESTIYGLSEGATSDEILSAIPVQYKDHFMAFINEKSEKERKKILKQLPEYLRKPLQIAWGEKPDKVDSNRKFFTKHKAPGITWGGWKPNINLKHVKMKTIQNEGMLLSDFGYYESEKSKMEYQMAPDVTNFDEGQSGLSYLSNMTLTMSGLGMTVQNISVEPTTSPGLWIAADVKQSISDAKKISGYAVNSGIQTLTSLLF